MPRIKKPKITYLSLCRRGKNQLPVLYKSDEGDAEIATLVKALPEFEDKGELLVVGYAPEHRDLDKHVADAETVREMAHSFMLEGANINIRHIDGTQLSKDQAYVAENFIIQKGDERFADFQDYNGNPVDVTGGWAVLIKIEDEKIRKLYKENGWNGISLQGSADIEQDERIQKALDYYTKHHEGNDEEMKPEELEAVLNRTSATMATTIQKAVTDGIAAALPKPVEKTQVEKDAEAAALALAKAQADKAPKPPEFKGDPLKKEDVAAHKKALKVFALKKDVDWNDPASIEKFEVALAKFEAEELAKEEDGDTDISKEDRSSDLNIERETTRSSSKVPAGFNRFNLTKEEREGFAIGNRMAGILNGTNGSKKS